MKSVCVILLDTSGSMAGGFEGEVRQRPREYDEAETKIEAAKKWLLAELDGLPNTEIALIAFDTEPRLVLRVGSSDTKRMKDLVPGIQAQGQHTNIAAALKMADEAHRSSKAHFKTIVLISDGLSNVGDPVAAGGECRQHGIQIKTILIDETPETKLLAEQISGPGNVLEASSGAEMRRAIHKASRPPLSNNLIPIIAAIVSVTGIVGTLSTLLSTGLDKPGLPEFVAGAALLCLLPVLIYVWWAREEGTPIYTTSTQFYTPKYFKYEGLRPYAGAAMLVCVSASFLLFRAGSEMRQALQLRITNATDYTLSSVKVKLPEIDDAFDFTIKPQQSSEYHAASLRLFTCLRLFAGRQQRRRGSVAVQTDASPAQPAQTVSQEDLLPNNGKYTLVVWPTLNPDGKKLIALRLNRE